jgi:hypothetical protein
LNDVFVSYSRADRPRAERLVGSLERRGFSVFWDREIPPGSTWDAVLAEQLSGVRCVVVLWSQLSVASDWVKTEAAEAKRLEKLVPVLIDDVPLPLEFRRIQTARLVDWSGQDDDAELGLVVAAVSKLVGRVPPPAPAVDARPRRARPWVLAAAIAIVALGAAAAWLALRPGPAPVLRFATADGQCPAALVKTPLTVKVAGSSVSGTIDGECRFRLPARVGRDLGPLEFTTPLETPFVFDTGRPKVPDDFPRSPATVLVAARQDAPRVELDLLPYAGLAAEGPRRAAFDEFRGILEDKLTNLVQELTASPSLTGDAAKQQLARLKLLALQWNGSQWSPAAAGPADAGAATWLDLENKLEVWQQRHSLGLLSGTLSEEGAGSKARFRVDGQIFIGDLDGAALGRSIPLSMKIGPEEFRNTRDAHALAWLYALALDARRLRYPDEVVTTYLSKAYSIAQTLREDSPGVALPEAVATIAARVDGELAELAKRSERP